MGKLIVISAPSGAGKTSIVHYLLKNIGKLTFSVSACSRDKRKKEVEGKDYYFIGLNQFKKKIKERAFLEWEEVYPNQYYGTLKKEVNRIWKCGNTVIFDVDVVGALNIKAKYQNDCLAIFIMPPSIKELKKRLFSRGSETQKKIETRLAKAKQEIDSSKEFDYIVLNDDFDTACKNAYQVVVDFIS